MSKLVLHKRGKHIHFKTKHKTFLSILSKSVDPLYRSFDAETGVWSVHVAKESDLQRIAAKYFDEVINEVEEIDEETSASPYNRLFLLVGAPFSLVKLCYTHLVSLYHPDHNEGVGDTQKLNEVLDAYREICDQTDD